MGSGTVRVAEELLGRVEKLRGAVGGMVGPATAAEVVAGALDVGLWHLEARLGWHGAENTSLADALARTVAELAGRVEAGLAAVAPPVWKGGPRPVGTEKNAGFADAARERLAAEHKRELARDRKNRRGRARRAERKAAGVIAHAETARVDASDGEAVARGAG